MPAGIPQNTNNQQVSLDGGLVVSTACYEYSKSITWIDKSTLYKAN